MGVCTEDGTAIGFLYIEKVCSLQQLREELQAQVRGLNGGRLVFINGMQGKMSHSICIVNVAVFLELCVCSAKSALNCFFL